jgi:hypothetical protein
VRARIVIAYATVVGENIVLKYVLSVLQTAYALPSFVYKCLLFKELLCSLKSPSAL